jgi:hypothetical protein
MPVGHLCGTPHLITLLLPALSAAHPAPDPESVPPFGAAYSGVLDGPVESAYGGINPPLPRCRAVTAMGAGDIRIRVVGELREEFDVRSLAATLVDAALAMAERDDESEPVAGRTDDDDRKADGS